MRLKSLELKGFKSFANDTVIHFDEDVIGIVGPNGSGKSNVVDAIRWVLGEQKGKELRLETLGDVIFNGTQKEKASPVAQVAITFDNNLGVLPSGKPGSSVVPPLVSPPAKVDTQLHGRCFCGVKKKF